MKDFQLRNDTKLLFRNDPVADLTSFTVGKKVLFVYGGGSAKRNSCYDDVKNAVENAGGANIMDCAKLIAFGTYHTEDLWEYVKAKKNPYGLKKLPLILMPTYPSSGSEYGLGAVSADSRTGDFGTAYGIAADTAILVPKYSTSGRLGLGKEENFAYDIYELEFIPEVLYGATYRKSLTTLFPRFLKAMANYHDSDIRRYFKDAFGYEGGVAESADKMVDLFGSLGVDMYFDGEVSVEAVKGINIATLLSADEVTDIVKESFR